ncbi:MAG: glutathione S-transferase family protein [Myxococcota bacterium]
MLRLHYHPTSPYSRKVSVAVAIRGDPVELRIVDVTAGEHRSPAFLALSPFGKLPVLETDHGVVFESTSEIEYLEERGPKLIPPPVAREVRHWDRVGDLYLLEPQGTMLFQPATDAARTAEATARTALRLLGERLGDGRRFLCGAAFTLADLGPAIAVDHLVRMEIELAPIVAGWLDRCFDVGPMRDEREAGRPLMDRFLERRRAALATLG